MQPPQPLVRAGDIDRSCQRLEVTDLVIEKRPIGPIGLGAPERAILFEQEEQAVLSGAKLTDGLRDHRRVAGAKRDAPQACRAVQAVGDRSTNDLKALDPGADRLARGGAIIDRRTGVHAIEQFRRLVSWRGRPAETAPDATTTAAAAGVENDLARLGE